MAMGGGKQVLVFLGVLLLLLVLLPEAQCGVTYDRKALIINGQRRILISGSIHYARSTPEVTQSHCCLFLFCSTWVRCLVNWLSLSCRCGRDLFRRLRMEDWMLYRLMCSGMGMNPLLEMYSDNFFLCSHWCLLLLVYFFFWLCKNLIFFCVICCCSIILRGGMIWLDLSRQRRKLVSMFIFELGLMLVPSGILGTFLFLFHAVNFMNLFLLFCYNFSSLYVGSGDFQFGWSMFLASASEQIMSLSRFLSFLPLHLCSLLVSWNFDKRKLLFCQRI